MTSPHPSPSPHGHDPGAVDATSADTTPPEHAAAIEAAIDSCAPRLGPEPRTAALLPILHGVQDRLGFIPPTATARIAQALNLSRAEVHGVISFYHDFRASQPGRHVLKLCRAEACQAMGSEALEARLKADLGVEYGETTADGRVTLEAVYCLGNCALAPAALLDGRPVGRATPERLAALLTALDRAPGSRS